MLHLLLHMLVHMLLVFTGEGIIVVGIRIGELGAEIVACGPVPGLLCRLVGELALEIDAVVALLEHVRLVCRPDETISADFSP